MYLHINFEISTTLLYIIILLFRLYLISIYRQMVSEIQKLGTKTRILW